MKIAVFCSANKNIDPDFFTITEEMGKWMAENGHDLVFGGCNSGLMDCIGKAVKAHGGRTIGVVPTLVERGGRTFPDLDIEIPCDNLSDRKDLMLAQSLDEIFTIAAAHTIGYHHKMVILYNMKGFWNSTIALLDDLAEKSMIRGDWRDVIEVADNLGELAKLCEG
uniref:LOG family protein n=1 Tax=Segatella hominis TaxID=2518605 RepID=UPI004024A867